MCQAGSSRHYDKTYVTVAHFVMEKFEMKVV